MKRALFLLLLFVSLAVSASVDAQTCPLQKPIRPWSGCTKCATASAPGKHLLGSRTYTVNIDPSIPAGLQAGVMAAFQNWQSHPSNTTGVSYVFTSSGSSLVAPGAPPSENVIQVAFGDPTGSSQAEVWAGSDWANILIDPAVSCVEAITQATSHEIGHTMGLADCANCCPGSSAMTPTTGMTDTTMGNPGPSDCDMQVASKRFEDDTMEEVQPRPSGGGAEPIDHLPQCTDYYLITWMWTQSGGFVIIDEDYLGCW